MGCSGGYESCMYKRHSQMCPSTIMASANTCMIPSYSYCSASAATCSCTGCSSPPAISLSMLSTSRGSCKLCRSSSQPLRPSCSSTLTLHPSWLTGSSDQPSAAPAPPSIHWWKESRTLLPTTLNSGSCGQQVETAVCLCSELQEQ